MKEHRYKLCPKCDYFCHISEADQYCQVCGLKLIESCPACGADIAVPYASFCKICGEAYPGKLAKAIKEKITN
jgi:hypothetical protein